MYIFSKNQRSEIMRAVKSKKNVSTEMALIKLFKEHKIKGWRRNCNLLGRPDFFFPKLKLVVFADGCFWHGCKCKKIPVANRNYWLKKISGNINRDKKVNTELKKRGYTVFRIKECKIARKKLPITFLRIFTTL